MRNQFDRQLEEMSEDLIRMGMLIEQSLEKVIHILQDKKFSLAEEINQYEIQVDELERKVQSQALRILFTQQPVAKDLRSISTALNLITDMERIADQACDIAEIALCFKDRKDINLPEDITEMVRRCIIMVKKSIDAFVTQNLAVAKEVIGADDGVDTLFSQVRDQLIDRINQNREYGEEAIDFIMIAKYLERIADHAVNIAEWVIFNITGEHKNQMLL